MIVKRSSMASRPLQASRQTSPVSLLSQHSFSVSHLVVAGHISGVSFPSTSVGFAVGGSGTAAEYAAGTGGSGQYASTNDGGSAWFSANVSLIPDFSQVPPVPTSIGLESFRDIYFYDSLHGAVVGTAGLFAYTGDGKRGSQGPDNHEVCMQVGMCGQLITQEQSTT